MVVCERLGRMNVVEVLEEWVDLKVRKEKQSERLKMMDEKYG